MLHRSLLVLSTLLTTAAGVAQVPFVGYWALDETAGLVATDFGPYGNHGTLFGYAANGTWVPGQYGNALQFDGIDDYVDLARNGGIPIYKGDGSPFSICFWVKAPANEDDRVYSEGQSQAATFGGALFTLGTGRSSNGSTGRLQLYLRNDAHVEVAKLYSTQTVFDDSWHHVAYVDAAGDAKVYVDGVLDTTSFDYRISGGATPNSGPQTANYGTYTTDRVAVGAVLRSNVVANFQGSVDDLRIFAFALSPADVQTVMGNNFPAVCRASLSEFGVGCGSGPFDLAASGSAVLGGPGVQLQMLSGVPGAASFLCFGPGRIAPTDLTPLGFAGCTAYMANMDCISGGLLDASGASAPIVISVPNSPSLACQQVNFQAAALDTSVPTLEFSDAVLAYLGG